MDKLQSASPYQDMCNSFHRADEDARAVVVFAAYSASNAFTGGKLDETNEEGAQSSSARAHLVLASRPVCVLGFCKMLGIGRRHFYRLAHGVPDLRRSCSGMQPRAAEKSAQVDMFLRHLYESAAEPLPKAIENGDLDAAAETVHVDAEAPEMPLVDDLLAWCQDGSEVATIPVSAGTEVVNLPRRWLPPGTLSDLYWQFLAWHAALVEMDTDVSMSGIDAPRVLGQRCEDGVDNEAASLSTFLRCYRGKWQQVLKCRKASEHAQCQTCFDLQSALYSGHRTLQQKLQDARAWRLHLQHQFQDRQIYWAFRASSRLRPETLVCIMIDSMDKKKCAWPQLPFHRASKELTNLIARPRLCWTAVLVHGWATIIACANDEVPHGANAYLEVLSQAVQFIHTQMPSATPGFSETSHTSSR